MYTCGTFIAMTSIDRKSYHHKWYLAHREESIRKAIEYQRTHKGRVNKLAQLRRKKNSLPMRKKEKRWRDKNIQAKKAHSKLRLAFERGETTKPSKCSVCNKKKKVEGHHDDYNKPLEVKWVCAACHKTLS